MHTLHLRYNSNVNCWNDVWQWTGSVWLGIGQSDSQRTLRMKFAHYVQFSSFLVHMGTLGSSTEMAVTVVCLKVSNSI